MEEYDFKHVQYYVKLNSVGRENKVKNLTEEVWKIDSGDLCKLKKMLEEVVDIYANNSSLMLSQFSASESWKEPLNFT